MLCPYCLTTLVRTLDDAWYCSGCEHEFDGCEADDILRDDGTPRYRQYDDYHAEEEGE